MLVVNVLNIGVSELATYSPDGQAAASAATVAHNARWASGIATIKRMNQSAGIQLYLFS